MSTLRRSHGLLALLFGLLVMLVAAGGASADPTQKAVYTATNNPAGNQVIVYTTNSDGSLTERQRVATGGLGISATPPFSFPFVDSSGSINLDQSGRVLFVVNAGDNTVSSFRVTSSGLELAARVSSHGVLPVSLTSHGNVVYVVNGESSNIYGFRYSSDGQMTPLGGQPLTSQFPTTVTAQVGFSPNGRQLVVTERGLPSTTGVIDTFNVNADGTAGPATRNTGVGFVDPNPFGFDFDQAGHLLVTNAGQVNAPGNGPPPIPQVFDPMQFIGSTTSYNLSASGSLTRTSNVLTGGRAACWIVVSKDGRYAFATSTLSDTVMHIFSGIGAVTSYAVAPDGTLTYLGQFDTSPGTPGDVAISQDGKYLYVLNAVSPVAAPDNSHIDTFRIGKDGSLTLVASLGGLPSSASGIAAN
jgi:6-phosphogluconolactonase (cycloisomerase 2 family)